MKRILALSLTTLVALHASPLAAGPIDPAVDSAMIVDPPLDVPEPIVRHSPRSLELWREALGRPEADLKRLAADSITRGQRSGMPGMAGAIPDLIRELERPGQHRVVRIALARALVELDARDAAAAFRDRVAGDLEVALVAEPALARWGDRPARDMWLARLDDATARRRDRLLAIECLGVAREPRAAPRLLELALDASQEPDARLAAAEALARVQNTGLEDTARRLTRDASAGLLDRLIAARLLSEHRGEAAEALLAGFAVDAEPAVAAIALGRLLEISPDLVLPLAPAALNRDDAQVRRIAAMAVVARPAVERVGQLAPLLDDVHPGIRRYVRQSLLEWCGEPALVPPIIEAALKALSGDGWRAQEQATFILVAREHRPAIPRLVELLESMRPEVFVTSAWALRRLDARDVIDAMLDRANRAGEIVLSGRLGASDELDSLCVQLGQLFEFFGITRHRAADPLLRRFIPKTEAIPPVTRGQAIWALGHIHAGTPEASLVRPLVGRLSDVASDLPEFGEVRAQSAVALGRMRAVDELPVLRRFAQQDSVGLACHWAIHQLTGEPIPTVEPLVDERRGWFLLPID